MSRLTPFADRAAIIFGASEGTGLAVAQALAGRVAGVGIVSRSAEKLAKAQASLKGKVHAATADITSTAETQRAFDACIGALGPAGIVINCAGAAHPGYFADLSVEVFEEPRCAAISSAQ